MSPAARLRETDLDRPLVETLERRPAGGLRLYWLGQAGFVIDCGGKRLVIDPYLSNSLAEKYRGTARPHIRMMPPPVAPDECAFVDLVLCTHAHTDHMDADTLKPLMARNPAARLIAPRAAQAQTTLRSGIADDRLILTDAGETLQPLDGLSITATRSAHETIETDEKGCHRFLGYGIDTGLARLWHSGDCVPFAGLEQEVRALSPDICLLPVNGRTPELSDNGVPGNFSLEEAIALSRALGVSDMIAHHYGLFDFNTADPHAIDVAARSERLLHIHRAKTHVALALVGQ